MCCVWVESAPVFGGGGVGWKVCVCVGGCGCGGVWKVCVVWVESAPFGGKVWCECGWSHFLLVVRCVCVCVRSEWVDGLAL